MKTLKDYFANQFALIDGGVSTRSSKVVAPTHEAIANFICEHSEYSTQSFPDSEYEFVGLTGTKKVDIAIFDKENNLKGVVMFKGIKNYYNKNANNYYDNMKGESSLFIDSNIPVYQICLIPTLVRAGAKFEIPGQKHIDNYSNFNNYKTAYWDLLKLGVWFFDIDYKNHTAEYSTIKVDGVEDSIEEGLMNFINLIKQHE